MDGDKPDKNRRGFLKFLAGIGLGAVGAEVYERVYNIPHLERRFGEEIREDLREALKEELVPFYYRRVLKPTGDFKGGVGTPFLCQHPDNGIMYMLFTGKPDPTVFERTEIYVGEIDEAFKVTNTRKLIESNFPNTNYPTHTAVSTVYDPYNDQWIVLTASGSYGSAGYPAAHWEVGFWRFNEDFTTMVKYQVPLNLTPEGGASQVWKTADVAPNLVRSHLPIKSAYFTTMGDMTLAAEWNNMYWGWTEDISVSVPTFVRQITPLVPKLTGYAYGSSLMAMDVHSLIMSRYGYIALVEAVGSEGFYRIFPIYINITPHAGATLGPRYALGGMSFDSLIYPAAVHDMFSYGHPHVTILPDNKLNLFFTFFKGFNGSQNQEIWQVKFMEEFFDPVKQRGIYFVPWYNQTIVADETSIPFFAFGKTTIYFTSDTIGKLTIEVSPAGSYAEWWTLYNSPVDVYGETYQTTYEAKSMRLKFNKAAKVTAIVVVNPRG